MTKTSGSDRMPPEPHASWPSYYLSLGLDVVPLEPGGTVAAGDVLRGAEELPGYFDRLPPCGVGLLCGEKLVAVVARPIALDLVDRLVERGYLPEYPDVAGGGPSGDRVWFFRADPELVLPNIELLPGLLLVGSGVVAAPATYPAGSQLPLFWREGHSIEQCLRTAVPGVLASLATSGTGALSALRAELGASKGEVVVEAKPPKAAEAPRPMSDEIDPDTARVEGWDGYSIGGLPAIEVVPNEEAMGTEALRILSMRRQDIYQRSKTLVMISSDNNKLSGVTVPRQLPEIVPISPARMRGILSSEMVFFKFKFVAMPDGSKKKVMQPCGVPDPLPNNLISRVEIEYIRQIEQVTETPTMRPDGSVLETPGYDEPSCVLYVPRLAFSPVPERPTRAEAKHCFDRLVDLFCDFPFANPRYGATAVSAILTLLARPAFDGNVPLFFVESNVRGSGKSLLVDIIHRLLYGNDAPRRTIARDDEEMRKKITSFFVGGDPIILLDNIRGAIDSPNIEAALTANTAFWKDRVLATNREVAIFPRCVWFATGNNAEYAGDIARRIARIKFRSDESNPENKGGYKYPNVLKHVSERRSALIVDGLTILRAYIAAGRPDMGLEHFGGFEGWSQLVRSSVAWASGVDPYDPKETAELDPEQNKIGVLMNAWARIEEQKNHPFVTVREALSYVLDSQDGYGTKDKFEDLQEILSDMMGLSPKTYLSEGVRRVGKLLAKHRDRVIGGRRFVGKPNRQDVMGWSVEQLS